MTVRMNQQEAGGFRLLQEDSLDDRPCPAVKKFVASVLDRKDMKDQDVAHSYRNLMEYRDSNSSPSACSAGASSSALDRDRPNSPPSPSSPTTAPCPMDDQRLPNELLDEICEDIGMKEGMELDFVEYLMEQDTNPQMYMTQEAISSGAFTSSARSAISTPTGSASSGSNSGSASGSHASCNNNNNNNNNNDSTKSQTNLNPPTTTTPNFLFKQNFADSEWLQQLPPTVIHSTSGRSSGSTTVQSSENNSPANKRVHLSASTDTSPNKGRSQTPPGFGQHNSNCGRTGTNGHTLFKMPQSGPLVTKRSHSYPQGAPTSSPVQSTSSSSSASSQASNTSSYSGFSRPQEFATNLSSSCHPGEQDEHSASSNSRKNCQSVSPKPVLPSASSSGDFNHRPASPSQARSQGQFNSIPGLVRGVDESMFRRVGPQSVPQAANIKSMQPHPQQLHPQQSHPQQSHPQQSHPQQSHPQQQVHPQQQHPQQQHPQQAHPHQQRWMNPQTGQVSQGQGHPGPYFNKGMYPDDPFQAQRQHAYHHPQVTGHLVHMSGPPDHHHHLQSSVPASADSPLDQGYFSNESAGNCSNGSAPSPAFTSSSMSSFSSISTVLPADHGQKQQQPPSSGSVMATGRPSGHKSVHFADMPDGSLPAYPQNCGMKQPFVPGSGPTSDCVFEMESNGQAKAMPSGKIMPRFHHSMKSGVAPYTVPSSQGQVIGTMPGYDMNNRASCDVSGSIERSSPEEYAPKSCHINGSTTNNNNSSNNFYMNGGNQSMIRMDSIQDYPSVPPPLISPHSGDYGHIPPEQSRYTMGQFSSMQQQTSHSQHLSHPSSADPMPPLHSHLQPVQHHHHEPHQNAPFSSCSYSAQGMQAELGAPHQNSMQISHDMSSGGYHVPLAVSTPMSSRVGSNTRFAGTYAGKMCSPVYEGSYEQSANPDMYPSQQTHSSQTLMNNQHVSSAPLGWAPEDLRIQVVDMQAPFSPMKGGLQHQASLNPVKAEHLRPHQPQSLVHMQPSPTPACAAPVGSDPHIQDLTSINPDIHGNSGMVPPHVHMDPTPHIHMDPPTHLGHHPEYGPCSGVGCPACKMAQTGSPPQAHPHIGPCPGANCHMCKINHPGSLPNTALPHAGPCAGPGCTACKMNLTNRPQMLSSQQKFIQHLIMDEANSAYRSHPLFPLLRDLVIAEMNFDNPRFHYQQLLSLLPNDFHKLLQNFLHRNPPSGHYQSNQAVESVIMDSLRLAHSNLVGKIRHRQEIEKIKAASSASLRSMEEFCQKFDHSVTGPMGRPGTNGSMPLGHPMAGYHEVGYIQHGVGHIYRSMKDGSEVFVESSLGATSPQANKTESKKHPSLPKEAVAMMMEWLRNHKDNPYPNDDEKAMLIKQTGLSINQINYWFTNARRRILPKWAQCKS